MTRPRWIPVFLLGLVFLTAGCNRLLLHTDNRVRVDGPIETRVHAEMPPVVPDAGPVRPVVVQPGSCPDRVAVVDVDGLIMNYPFVGPGSVGENPVALFREKLDAVESDPGVRAVVLRVHSPGGGVAACISMRRDLERFKARTRLPVVACLLDTATGGAYYLASAADQVVAHPGTVTGAVGVLLNLFNLHDLMTQYNVLPQLVKAGEFADIGTSARELTRQEQELLQSMANEYHELLKTGITTSRPRADPTAFDGRIFTATQAQARGLVDRVGDLDQAIELAGQLGCPNTASRPQVTMYRRSNDPARSAYAVTANLPLQGAGFLPNLPGLDRSKLPTFLSVWEPELTMEKLGGR